VKKVCRSEDVVRFGFETRGRCGGVGVGQACHEDFAGSARTESSLRVTAAANNDDTCRSESAAQACGASESSAAGTATGPTWPNVSELGAKPQRSVSARSTGCRSFTCRQPATAHGQQGLSSHSTSSIATYASARKGSAGRCLRSAPGLSQISSEGKGGGEGLAARGSCVGGTIESGVGGTAACDACTGDASDGAPGVAGTKSSSSTPSRASAGAGAGGERGSADLKAESVSMWLAPLGCGLTTMMGVCFGGGLRGGSAGPLRA
jgi:hypothetical protein